MIINLMMFNPPDDEDRVAAGRQSSTTSVHDATDQTIDPIYATYTIINTPGAARDTCAGLDQPIVVW